MAEQNPKPILSPVESLRPKPKYLQIRDLHKYQHYKDRNPPWVKLYGAQLEDYEFQQLPDAMKFHAIALTYLAAKTGNKIPYDPEWVGSRIGAREPVNLDMLISHGFLEEWRPRLQEPGPGEQLPLSPAASAGEANPTGTSASGDASKMLADRYQSASTETEREGETETHTETDTEAASAAGPRVCVCCGLKVFSRFTLAEALSLAREWKRTGKIVGGRPVENPGGLARKLHIEGTADTEIEEFVRSSKVPKRAFKTETCKACFGSKQEIIPGKGARPCPRCVDEQGHRTGFEPLDDS